MSRVRFVALVLFATCYISYVCPTQAQDVTVGVRNGVVRSTIQGELFYPSLALEGGQVRKAHRTGFQVTGFVALSLSKRFALRGELQYAQRGAAIRGQWAIQDCGGPLRSCIRPSLEGTYQISFVQLPVLMSWYQSLGQDFGLRLMAGPSLDLLLDTRIKTRSLHESALPENARTPRTDSVIGAVGGVELQYDVSSIGAVQIGGRYHPSVTKISVINSETQLQSRAYVVSVGYTVQL